MISFWTKPLVLHPLVIHPLVFSQTSDVDSRMRLYEHIVLSGGNTMFPGLPTRLERELKDLYCSGVLKVGRLLQCTRHLCVFGPPNTHWLMRLNRAELRACNASSSRWRTPQPVSIWCLLVGPCLQTS